MLLTRLSEVAERCEQEDFEKVLHCLQDGLQGNGKCEDCIEACNFLKTRLDILRSIGWDLIHVLIPFVIGEPRCCEAARGILILVASLGNPREVFSMVMEVFAVYEDVRQQQLLLEMLAQVFPKLAKGKLHIFVKDLLSMLHRRFVGLSTRTDKMDDHSSASSSLNAERSTPASPDQMHCDQNSALHDVLAPADILTLNKGFFDAVLPACQTFFQRLLDDMNAESYEMICQVLKDLLKALYWTSSIVSTEFFMPEAEKKKTNVFHTEDLSNRVLEVLDLVASLPNGILFVLFPPSRPFWMMDESKSMEQILAELDECEDVDDGIEAEGTELPASKEYLYEGAGSLSFFIYLSSSSKLGDANHRVFFHPFLTARFRGVLILPGISELLSSHWSNHVRAGIMLLEFTIKVLQEHGQLLAETDLELGTPGIDGKNRQICMQIVQGLATAMTQLPEQHSRHKAYKLLRLFTSVLAPEPRFAVMKDLITRCPYPSVTSVALNIVKDEILHSWPTSQHDIDQYQHDTKRTPFIALSVSLLFEVLSSSQKALLLHRLDILMSGLNVLRFILIKDRQSNLTGVWEHNIRRKFLDEIVNPSRSVSREHLSRSSAPEASEGGCCHISDTEMQLLMLQEVLDRVAELLDEPPQDT
mmetsp:Transcript_42598/g.134111  ORF Transcript_42598/g.134111 Transcript_42598/m.134111 type:complete len:644 (-) Transcript_42598:76-2007(-)